MNTFEQGVLFSRYDLSVKLRVSKCSDSHRSLVSESKQVLLSSSFLNNKYKRIHELCKR